MAILFPNPCNPCDPCGSGDCNTSLCEGKTYIESSCGFCQFSPFDNEPPQTYVIDVDDLDCCPAASGRHELTYNGGCFWQSREFSCGSDKYAWRLLLQSVQPLSLVKVSGAGTPIVLYYDVPAASDWKCSCENIATLGSGSVCSSAPNTLCVRPEETCWGCDNNFPACFEIAMAGIVDGDCGFCSGFNGVFTLKFERLLNAGFGTVESFCVYRTEDTSPCNLGTGTIPPKYELFISNSTTRNSELFALEQNIFTDRQIIASWRIPKPIVSCNQSHVATGFPVDFICDSWPTTVNITPVTC